MTKNELETIHLSMQCFPFILPDELRKKGYTLKQLAEYIPQVYSLDNIATNEMHKTLLKFGHIKIKGARG